MAGVKVISDFEVLAVGDAGRRRGWTDAEKVRIVEESLRGQRQGSATARRHGIARSLLTRWRKEFRCGLLEGAPSLRFTPVRITPEPAPAPSEMPAPGAADRIEIALVNGRRLTVSAAIDPAALARLLPVLERA